MITPGTTNVHNLVTEIGSSSPSRIHAGDSQLTAFIDAVMPVVGESHVLVKIGGYASEEAIIEKADTSGLDIESIAKVILSTPDSEYVEYEFIDPDSPEATFIKNYYGIIPDVFFLSLGSKGFLKIGDKYLTLRK